MPIADGPDFPSEGRSGPIKLYRMASNVAGILPDAQRCCMHFCDTGAREHDLSPLSVCLCAAVVRTSRVARQRNGHGMECLESSTSEGRGKQAPLMSPFVLYVYIPQICMYVHTYIHTYITTYIIAK
jgi:hypothetical protein